MRMSTIYAVVKLPCTTKIMKSQVSIQSLSLKNSSDRVATYHQEAEILLAHLCRESKNRFKHHCDVHVIANGV